MAVILLVVRPHPAARICPFPDLGENERFADIDTGLEYVKSGRNAAYRLMRGTAGLKRAALPVNGAQFSECCARGEVLRLRSLPLAL